LVFGDEAADYGGEVVAASEEKCVKAHVRAAFVGEILVWRRLTTKSGVSVLGLMGGDLLRR
jgi:hypothetical protein